MKSNTSKWTVVATTAIIGGIAFYAISRQPGESNSITDEQLLAKMEELTRQTQAIQAQAQHAERTALMATRTRSTIQTQDDKAEEEEEKEPGEEPETSAAEALSPDEESLMRISKTRELMRETLHAQTPDPGWTAEATDKATELLAAPEYAGNHVKSVDCGEGLCEFALQHDGEEAFEKFKMAMSLPPFNGNLFFSYDKDTGTSSVYLAKKGAELPELD
jgi:hypothetical protein